MTIAFFLAKLESDPRPLQKMLRRTGRIGDGQFENLSRCFPSFDNSDYGFFIIDLRISGRLVMMPSAPISIRRCISERESGVHTNTWIPS